MIWKQCEALRFPRDAQEHLQMAENLLLAQPNGEQILLDAERRLFTPGDERFNERLNRLAQLARVNPMQSDMVLLLRSAPRLLEEYRRRNLPESVYWDTMADLRYKLMECYAVHALWGTFVVWWFKGFYLCERFALGRLQYEIRPVEVEDYRGIVKKGDPVPNIHIPSAGPLSRNRVLDSLARAYAFYPQLQRDGILPVMCSSWLLYPPQFDVYPEGGNLRDFVAMFDILSTEERPDNPDFWRIFDVMYTPEILDYVPQDTRLRRNFLHYFREGGTLGEGHGILLFDGEKLI